MSSENKGQSVGEIRQRLKYLKVFTGKRASARIFRKLIWFALANRIHTKGNRFFAYCILKKCRVTVKGKNNTIEIAEGCLLDGVEIQINGNNNRIVIGKDTSFHEGSKIVVNGDINQTLIGSRNYFVCVSIVSYDDNNVIQIGDDNICASGLNINSMEGRKITFGSGNLFSYDIEFRNSDSHSILDGDGKRINSAKDITVCDKVWISQKTLILKGAYINDNCVVGAGAIVTGHTFASNSLLIGSPAKIAKEKITWNINRI